MAGISATAQRAVAVSGPVFSVDFVRVGEGGWGRQVLFMVGCRVVVDSACIVGGCGEGFGKVLLLMAPLGMATVKVKSPPIRPAHPDTRDARRRRGRSRPLLATPHHTTPSSPPTAIPSACWPSTNQTYLDSLPPRRLTTPRQPHKMHAQQQPSPPPTQPSSSLHPEARAGPPKGAIHHRAPRALLDGSQHYQDPPARTWAWAWARRRARAAVCGARVWRVQLGGLYHAHARRVPE